MLNITLKCLWFFPRRAANITIELCGVGVDGTQLSRLRAPPCLRHTPCTAQTSREERPVLLLRLLLLSSLPKTKLTQSCLKAAEPLQTPHPRTPSKGLPGISPTLPLTDLSCPALVFHSCTIFPLFTCYFLPPRQTKMTMPMLCIFLCLSSEHQWLRWLWWFPRGTMT